MNTKTTRKANQSLQPKEKKPRKPRTKYPYALTEKIVTNGLPGEDITYRVSCEIQPEDIAKTVFPNSFDTVADALAAAETIPDFCTEHYVHPVMILPRIIVRSTTKIKVKLGE